MRKRVIVREYGGKNSPIHLENFTFVLESHPTDENYFISGGGGGKVIIWDITKDQNENAVVKSFTESGVYQRDPNILNEVFDGKFSSCGKHFVISTVWGTFTIYSIFSKESYYATPVEQFFQYDKAPESHSNIYNEVDAYLCNYDRLKYSEQPPLPILGERYIGEECEDHEYEKMFSERYAKFSKDQKYFENFAEEYAPYATILSKCQNYSEMPNILNLFRSKRKRRR